MERLCWSYAPTAYGPINFPAGPTDQSDLWSGLLADIAYVAAGVVGGILAAVLIVLVVLRRNDRTYLTPTCGNLDHLHLPRRTAGGGRVYVCGPPYHSTCGDDSHPHVSAMTTTGDHAFVCLTARTDDRIRRTSLIHHARKEHA